MEHVVSATEARIHFSEMMRRATDDQEIIIVERYGAPQIALMSAARYWRLAAGRQEGAHWREQVDRARAQIARELAGRKLPPPEEVIRPR
jgi:prevent-host-death family protein